MQLAGKRVLVTGGAGFIGSHLVDALQGCQVRVLDNFSTGKAENLERARQRPEVEVVTGDLLGEGLAEALQDIDVVFHLACRGVRHSLSQPLQNHEVNATGTLRLLQAVRAAGVKRLVHVSSSEVYGTAGYVPMDEEHPCRPETVYGSSKLAGEMYARAYQRTYGVPVVVVRPFNNFGPRSHHEGDAGEVIPRFAVWALHGRPPVIFGDGEQTRDFLYVEDTAYWLCRAAECDELIGQTINLGSGVETSVRELANLIYDESGQAGMAAVHRPARAGDVRRHLASVERARRCLGFQPRTTLRQGIRKVVEHFRTRGAQGAALLEEVPEINWACAR